MNIRRMFIASIFIMSSSNMFCKGATETLAGDEEGFWDNRSVVVGRVASASTNGSIVTFEFNVAGVVITDIYVPTSLTISYTRSRNSPLLTLDVAVNDYLLICLEHVDGSWTIPSIRSSLFESGITAVKLSGENDPAIRILQTHLSEAKKRSLRASISN